MAPHVCDRVVLAAVFAAVEAEATRRLASGELGVDKGGSMRMWAWMKQTLREQHGITWRTPLEMTPGVVLDRSLCRARKNAAPR
jgi:hypothetical protein